MRLRRGRPADAEVLATIHRRCTDEMAYLPTLHTPAEDVTFLRDVVLATQEVWVAEEARRVVGYCSLSNDELHHLYLAPEARNRGIGKALLERAKERMPNGFTLWTFQANDGARRFYEREGLTAVQFTDGEHNEERTPDVQYEWRA